MLFKLLQGQQVVFPKVNKFHPPGNASVVTVQRNLERPFAVHVFHRQRQPLNRSHLMSPEEHPCSPQPCDHFCLPTAEEPFYRCACRAGYEVTAGSPAVTCAKIERDKFLLYGQQRPGIVRGVDLGEVDPKVTKTSIILVRVKPRGERMCLKIENSGVTEYSTFLSLSLVKPSRSMDYNFLLEVQQLEEEHFVNVGLLTDRWSRRWNCWKRKVL